ncbi:MAG: cell division protein SepF [Acidimicrobiales bacterium]|jgi:FtsZ-interacting cell division protein YlmF
MNEKMRHVLGFLGLVEDEYGDNSTGARPFSEVGPYDSEPEPTIAAPARAVRTFPTVASGTGTARNVNQPLRVSSISVLDASGQSPRVRAMNSSGVRGASSTTQERDIAIFFPSSYHESRRITDLLRANRAVLLNVTEIEANLARRLVDFAAGTAYAVNAKIEPLANGVYLISPQGTYISPDAKDRMRASNYRSIDFA